jgi:uncharacterized repeat protein (TIGR02543 family)
VIYDTQGGSTVASTPYLPGDTVNLTVAVPTRSGHRFTGWFDAASGGSPVTSPIGPLGAEDTTVFAQWVPLTISPGTQTVSGVAGTAITPTTAFTPAEFSGTPLGQHAVLGLPDGFLYWTVRGDARTGDLVVRIDPRTGATRRLGGASAERLYGLGYADGVLFGFSADGLVVELAPRDGRVISEKMLSARWWGATTNPVVW